MNIEAFVQFLRTEDRADRTITGTFYDELGQIVAEGNTTGRWPPLSCRRAGAFPLP